MNYNRIKILFAAGLFSVFMTGCAATPTISSDGVSEEKKAANNVSDNKTVKMYSFKPEGGANAVDTSESQMLLMYDTVRVSAEQMKALSANLSYSEILEKLGDTQAFGQPKYRQYVTEDDRIIQLHFESKDDICPYSGEELYDRAMPLKYDGSVPDGMIYGLLAGNGGFATYRLCRSDGTVNITGDYLNTTDAEIVFEDGTPAAEDDLKPETAVFIASDYTLETYPGQMHCTKIVILK